MLIDSWDWFKLRFLGMAWTMQSKMLQFITLLVHWPVHVDLSLCKTGYLVLIKALFFKNICWFCSLHMALLCVSTDPWASAPLASLLKQVRYCTCGLCWTSVLPFVHQVLHVAALQLRFFVFLLACSGGVCGPMFNSPCIRYCYMWPVSCFSVELWKPCCASWDSDMLGPVYF